MKHKDLKYREAIERNMRTALGPKKSKLYGRTVTEVAHSIGIRKADIEQHHAALKSIAQRFKV
jgi:hypothetical protein